MKILFTPYSGGSIAHIVRSLALADELKARGHEILFTTTTNKKAFVEEAGFRVHGDGHKEVNLNDEDDQSINYFIDNRKKFINWLGDEIAAAEEFKPDIIVNSPSFFGPIAGLKLGIPYVTVLNAQWLHEFHGVLGLGYSNKNRRHSFLRRVIKPIFEQRFAQVYMKEIRSFYQELGASPRPRRQKDLHSKNPVIIPSIPEFEPIHISKRKDIHYIGPLFWRGFEADSFDPLLLFREAKKPLIYISFGGSVFKKRTYQKIIESLSNKKEWNILLSLGPNFAREEFIDDMDHLVIKNYFPGLKVCEHADLVINTAGHGTVMQSLWHGKPLITLPHNIDQSTIANRLEELEIGKNLNKASILDFTKREKYAQKAGNISWYNIERYAEEILKDPKTRTKASEFQTILRKYSDAEKKGADLIEFYAKQNQKQN